MSEKTTGGKRLASPTDAELDKIHGVSSLSSCPPGKGERNYGVVNIEAQQIPDLDRLLSPTDAEPTLEDVRRVYGTYPGESRFYCPPGQGERNYGIR